MKAGFDRGNTDWYIRAFKNFEQNLNGYSSEPIHTVRKKALQLFSEFGFPTVKNEEWKYTNIAPISNTDFQPIDSADAAAYKQKDITRFVFQNLDAYRLVFINGHYTEHLSAVNGLTKGLHIGSVKEAILRGEKDVLQKIGQIARAEDDSFTALNTAFLYDGAFIEVMPGKQVEKPVHLLFLSTETKQPVLHQPRNIFLLGENSDIKIIETYASATETEYLTNAVSEIELGPSAVLEHFRIQTESRNAFHIGTTQVHQDHASNYVSHSHSFGGRIIRNNINIVLDAENIESSLNGVYVGTDKQLIDNHTSIDHAKPNCRSIELYKGILSDQAHGVFNGKIFVRQDAQKTNAIQSNKCVLLSDNATIDTKPQLEIFADDVRCTHGATVGQLDEDAYFYMRARGIDKDRARNLLIHAFAADVFDRINIAEIREHVIDLFIEKLHTVKPV